MCIQVALSIHESNYLFSNNLLKDFNKGRSNNNNIYLKSNAYKHMSSVDCSQYGLYNLKQYDHNQILNELVILHYCIL